MTFHVGQKVVRIDRGRDDEMHVQRNASRYVGVVYPKIGEVVTIKTINHWPHVTLLTFCEYDNSQFVRQGLCKIEPGFDREAFRPVVKRKTDISIFKKMLRGASRDMEIVA